MFSSLLRPVRNKRRRDHSPFSTSYAPSARSPDVSRANTQRRRRRSSDQEHDNLITEEEESEGDGDEDDAIEDDMEDEDEDVSESDEDGPDDNAPLLPIFSAARLDSVPTYALTHAIRTLVSSKCDTVLTWEQLRSPQVSQFLVKPIEQEVRRNHLNPATEYALLSNCLQYTKEAADSVGNSGTNSTRAMICELLAIKLLRDHSTRELIDALSYDFDPLQGYLDMVDSANVPGPRGADASRKHAQRPARISCFEVAIRAQAKRFLAHPLVVKQLEAIWAGTIVFHSAADNLHRKLPVVPQHRTYGTVTQGPSSKGDFTLDHGPVRRAVTLYNPRDASLFKLSRLRVPRYRNVLSTMSFAVLLSLFVAVLVQRSLEITPLEVFFWFWAAGYMLDEVVGFNEQGFSLYLASFWNTFDLGILLVLLIHLALRVYGILMPDVRKHTVANLAYDILAADAILLFPRLFSVLDHYRYFSPLLIAFRYMAADLVAVSLLILISCSGFFVALTLSFGNDGVDTPSSVAYALLQMVMGFTPAAWDRWDRYNALGKFILTLFLFICHFLVVTILVTVLTNSFMAIVRNAHEEHQFLFAVNTISHVKSDALFSYVAPTNIVQWTLVPTRYFLTFRQYVKLNRTMIKVTHFPLLFIIYLYEKTILQATIFDSIDLVERRGRPKRTHTTTKLTRLNRAPSIATFRQDMALEEVFRQPFDSTMRSAQHSRNRRKTSNVVKSWMKGIGEEMASSPGDHDRAASVVLEGREVTPRRGSRLRPFTRPRDFSRNTMSIASDPADFMTHTDFLSPQPGPAVTDVATPSPLGETLDSTDADGDDELVTNDELEEEAETATFSQKSAGRHDPDVDQNTRDDIHQDYFANRKSPRSSLPGLAMTKARTAKTKTKSGATSPMQESPQRRPRQHSRNASTATMIFKPATTDSGTENSSRGETTLQVSGQASGTRTPISKQGSNAAGHRTPKRQGPGPTRMRPIMANQENPAFRSTPNFAALIDGRSRPTPQRRPSLEMDLVSDIGDNRALGGGFIGALPASFASQLGHGGAGTRHGKDKAKNDEQQMFTKIMMARMNTLEEGFREVIHEMRESMRNDPSRSRSRGRAARPAAMVTKEKRKEKERDRPSTAGNKENVDPDRDGTAATKDGVEKGLDGEQNDTTRSVEGEDRQGE
ncbi:hypothetical protein PV10_04886 [Exophiala mesophila]|uniref:Ion transport domain-containing protein n=1 Tax=Exophiala mesophila TaxID=212818 RepID=A0A0D1XZJ3_EXOME|nr:uncharacterized protein PV10_04886 [Exophiala mesophila]KIV93691.1 hypothetical protein PV10_04886 [Exophiala mesophila]